MKCILHKMYVSFLSITCSKHFIQVNTECVTLKMHAEIHVGLCEKCLLLLSVNNQNALIKISSIMFHESMYGSSQSVI
jgi:hypothetical protein